MCVHTRVCTYMQRPEDDSTFLPQLPFNLVFEIESLTHLGLTEYRWGQLAGQMARDTSISTFSTLGWEPRAGMPSFLRRYWWSGPHLYYSKHFAKGTISPAPLCRIRRDIMQKPSGNCPSFKTLLILVQLLGDSQFTKQECLSGSQTPRHRIVGSSL